MEISEERIRKILSDTISSIQNDCINYIDTEKEMAIHQLANFDLIKTDRQKYYLLNNIKIEEKGKLPYWNPKYLNESLNDIYIKLIANVIIDELKKFADVLLVSTALNNDTPKFEEELEERKVLVENLFKYNRNKGGGIMRYLQKEKNDAEEHEKESKVHRLLYPRFEIIKELNLEYCDQNAGSGTAMYPYFKVDSSQFLDFEYIYWFFKLFEEIEAVIKGTGSNEPKGLGKVHTDKIKDDKHPVFISSSIVRVIDDYLEYYGVLDENHKVIDYKRLGPYCKAFYDITKKYTKTVFKKKSPSSEFQAWVKDYYSTPSDRLSSGESHEEEARNYINSNCRYLKE